jgi:hypothetical protein
VLKRLLIALAMLMAAAPGAESCPLCKEAIPEASEGQNDYDPVRQSLAYNYSIYFMLGVPFALAGTMGLFIYRQCRRVERHTA